MSNIRDDKAAGRIGVPSATRRRLLKGAAATFALPFLGRMAAAQDVKTIKVGQIQAVTGPSAEHGIRSRDGAIFAAEELNKTNGVRDQAGRQYKLELLEADMANDPRQAITLFRNYASDASILCVLGPANSVGFLPMTPVAAQFEIPLIGNGSGAPIKEWNPWTYRVNPTSAVATPILLKKIVDLHKVKRLAIIYDQTQEVQAGDAALCRKLSDELGYKVVADEAYKSGDQDFSAQISKVKFSKADALFLAASPGDGAKAAAQIAEAGINLPLLTGFGAFQDSVYWDNSGGAIKDGYTWIAQDLAQAGAGLADWTKRYNERFRFAATIQSTFGYESVYVLAAAISKSAEPNRKSLQAALSNLSISTPIGTSVEFKNPPAGDNLKPTVNIIQINGRGQYHSI